MLKEIKNISGDSPWLFPSDKKDDHITSAAVDHAVRRSEKAFPEVKDWTPHDLRRTAATHMTSMGISRLVVSKILNHVESGVTAIYDRHSYDAEKKSALELWAVKLGEIVSGEKESNIVKLRA